MFQPSYEQARLVRRHQAAVFLRVVSPKHLTAISKNATRDRIGLQAVKREVGEFLASLEA
jgi:hypothetical protein